MASEGEKKDIQTGRLGTFAGVFTPSILTILGIILFLRTGYVVGSAGLLQILLIIGLANIISIFTSLSLSAIATNLKVKGGGDYYLISRTLGFEFGGAIGIVLFLAQAVSIAFYCIGFGEALAMAAFASTPGVSPRLIALAAVAFLFVFAWMGADWASRFQFLVMGLLVAALASFFVGGALQWNPTTLSANLSAPADGLPFWVLFALFFPAVTGFTQGVSMSGDLQDSSRSLPLGTLLAVGVSMMVYLGAAVIFSGALSNQELTRDYQAMSRIALFPGLITAGVIAATLSSAMASFLGAPRILQALAADRIFPRLDFFAQGAGPANNPRRAIVLAGGIACLTIALGNLNVVAPVVSMFFLVSYGLLNYATYYEADTESPSFRPAFRWFHKRLSLIGALACLGIMLAIDPATGIIAVAILLAIYQYLRRTADPARWADSRRAHELQRIREGLLGIKATPEHPRDWRPQILAFTQDAHRRPRLLRLAAWLEGGSGLTTLVTLLQGKDLLLAKQKEQLQVELRGDIKEHNPAAFPLVLTTPDGEIAVHTLLQTHGIGPLRVNTILLNWIEPEQGEDLKMRQVLLGRQLKTVYRQNCNICILHAEEHAWERLMATDRAQSCIDVWWSDDASGRLMLLFAYLLTRSSDWEDTPLRLLAFRDNRSQQDQETALRAALSDARIGAEIVFVAQRHKADLIAASEPASIIFLPFTLQRDQLKLPIEEPIEDLLDQLPPTVMVLAAEDIDLSAEPDEGAAAELAKARDLVEKLAERAEEADKLATEAEEKAQKAEQVLREALQQDQTEQDEEQIAQLTREHDDHAEAADKARRQAAKDRVKADDAAQEESKQTETGKGKNGGEP
ncbi:transporter, cation-chloride cotransporter (CCC) family [Geoalkalibacter ferrihydriticus]|uniref:Transporter, cation-chloride cotransporter (CCC) family n=1 Tax=Geoalkalibacter ferrihydriticus TaxID=392333 RepID=A0A1G9JPZ6_9BACT|nr:amino acid permease [Geoalkalibacter ferrihydriticus]SDL39073.1 transporter, cation-chloride cotransporter (CCC) family [Geoalkalibacter ferrihydriticus]